MEEVETYEEFLMRINEHIKDPELMKHIIVLIKEMDESRKITKMLQKKIFDLDGEWENNYCPCCSSVCDEVYSSSERVTLGKKTI